MHGSGQLISIELHIRTNREKEEKQTHTFFLLKAKNFFSNILLQMVSLRHHQHPDESRYVHWHHQAH